MERITEVSSSPAARQVPCNDLVFPVLEWGRERGRPVLLLHGFPQEPFTWSTVAEALAQDGFYAVAPSQRGYTVGAQPREMAGYTFAHFAEDVVGIADAIGLDEFDIVGFGAGGLQAWMVAARNPTRVRSLTSIRFPHPAAFAHALQSNVEQREKWSRLQHEIGAGNPAATAAAMLADDGAGLRRFLVTSGLPESFLDRYVSRLRQPGVLTGALSWNQAVSLEEFSTVPAVLVPTLLLWSEGPALGYAAAEASRAFVHAPFTGISLREGGHFLLETSPAAVIEPLWQHLRAT